MMDVFLWTFVGRGVQFWTGPDRTGIPVRSLVHENLGFWVSGQDRILFFVKIGLNIKKKLRKVKTSSLLPLRLLLLV